MSDTEKEIFESGAVRDKVPYRYDLCSPLIVKRMINSCPCSESVRYPAAQLASNLLTTLEISPNGLWNTLILFVEGVLETTTPKSTVPEAIYAIMSKYAETLHEGASKYGERNWEKGLPQENLVSHAVHHLIAYVCGDTTEQHFGHLIWNVVTLIHFGDELEAEKQGPQKTWVQNCDSSCTRAVHKQ